MIRATLCSSDAPTLTPRTRRSRFGLDAPLPADPRIVERAVLRLLAEAYPDLVVLKLAPPAEAADPAVAPGRVDPSRGVPDLLVLRPGGGLVFLAIRPQAHRPSRAERAFADLCRTRAIPLHTIRALPEARRVLERFNNPTAMEPHDGEKQVRVARRTA